MARSNLYGAIAAGEFYRKAGTRLMERPMNPRSLTKSGPVKGFALS